MMLAVVLTSEVPFRLCPFPPDLALPQAFLHLVLPGDLRCRTQRVALVLRYLHSFRTGSFSCHTLDIRFPRSTHLEAHLDVLLEDPLGAELELDLIESVQLMPLLDVQCVTVIDTLFVKGYLYHYPIVSGGRVELSKAVVECCSGLDISPYVVVAGMQPGRHPAEAARHRNQTESWRSRVPNVRLSVQVLLHLMVQITW